MVHIHSTIICLGGWNVAQYFDNAIMFDTETEIWSDAGVMKVPRGRPGASVVNLEDVIEYATDCETKELPIPSSGEGQSQAKSSSENSKLKDLDLSHTINLALKGPRQVRWT